jgi:bacteriorhodopsin
MNSHNIKIVIAAVLIAAAEIGVAIATIALYEAPLSIKWLWIFSIYAVSSAAFVSALMLLFDTFSELDNTRDQKAKLEKQEEKVHEYEKTHEDLLQKLIKSKQP